MADSVIYTEIKFQRSPGEDARMTMRTAPINQTEAQLRLTSKLFWIIGGAILILLITVVGLTIEIIRLHGERIGASVQSQADRPLTEIPSTEIQQALCGCPSELVQYKDLCYHIFRVKLTRDSAHSSCLNISSQLADTEDPGILSFLRQHLKNMSFWIGLKRKPNGSDWFWMNGRPLNMTHYFSNTNHSARDCATVSKTKIYAEMCHEKRGYICEKKVSSQP
ncbi:hypothetical protein MATL_G00013160 [Megalops atlanticus]|uniref:C-type lectin domain-containing protein n=1 Tax=Megalops atlanticus TaxID=7932 RepID=A0A9D3QHJ1_MEGAT|nr:hypothetical protein MATL_G00013160 [Megalops atlanticus]